MKYTFVFLILIVCLSSLGFAQDPSKVSPDIYKVITDNDDVTVMEITFKPGQSDNMHSHLVHTVYVIQGGKIKLTMPDGTAKEMEIPSGASMHLGPATHMATNVGETELKLLAVEHKKLKEAAMAHKAESMKGK
jgi:quercetin dioxygenase-like cupin family protein